MPFADDVRAAAARTRPGYEMGWEPIGQFRETLYGGRPPGWALWPGYQAILRMVLLQEHGWEEWAAHADEMIAQGRFPPVSEAVRFHYYRPPASEDAA